MLAEWVCGHQKMFDSDGVKFNYYLQYLRACSDKRVWSVERITVDCFVPRHSRGYGGV
jgi:hypothetical protein